MLVLILRLLMIGDVLASRQASFIRISGGGGFWTVVQQCHQLQLQRACCRMGKRKRGGRRERRKGAVWFVPGGVWWCAWWCVCC